MAAGSGSMAAGSGSMAAGSGSMAAWSGAGAFMAPENTRAMAKAPASAAAAIDARKVALEASAHTTQ